MANIQETFNRADPWETPGSLGLSTWERHVGNPPSAHMTLIQPQQYLFREQFNKRMSFGNNLIARSTPYSGPSLGKPDLIFRVNRFWKRMRRCAHTEGGQPEMLAKRGVGLPWGKPDEMDHTTRQDTVSAAPLLPMRAARSIRPLSRLALASELSFASAGAHPEDTLGSGAIHLSSKKAHGLMGLDAAADLPATAGLSVARSTGLRGKDNVNLIYIAGQAPRTRQNPPITIPVQTGRSSARPGPLPRAAESLELSQYSHASGRAEGEVHGDDIEHNSPHGVDTVLPAPSLTRLRGHPMSAELSRIKRDNVSSVGRSNRLARSSLPLSRAISLEPGHQDVLRASRKISMPTSSLHSHSGTILMDTGKSRPPEIGVTSSFEKMGGETNGDSTPNVELSLPEASIVRRTNKSPSTTFGAAGELIPPSSKHLAARLGTDHYSGSLSNFFEQRAALKSTHRAYPVHTLIRSGLRPLAPGAGLKKPEAHRLTAWSFPKRSDHLPHGPTLSVSAKSIGESHRPLKSSINRATAENGEAVRRPSELTKLSYSSSPEAQQQPSNQRLSSGEPRQYGEVDKKDLNAAWRETINPLRAGFHTPPIRSLTHLEVGFTPYDPSALPYLRRHIAPPPADHLSRRGLAHLHGLAGQALRFHRLVAPQNDGAQYTASVKNHTTSPAIARLVGVTSGKNRGAPTVSGNFAAQPEFGLLWGPVAPRQFHSQHSQQAPISTISGNLDASSTGAVAANRAPSPTFHPTSTFLKPPMTELNFHLEQRSYVSSRPTSVGLPIATQMSLARFPFRRLNMIESNGGPSTKEPSDRSQASVSSFGMTSLNSKGPFGFRERPLLNLQQRQNQVMRRSETSTGERPDSDGERYGVVPAPHDHSSNMNNDHHSHKASGVTESSSGGSNADEVAERAWRIMAERLVIERERRGLAKWP